MYLLGKTFQELTARLSILSIEVVARSKFGKMVFVASLPSMIGSIATLAANWMSHTPQIP